MRAILFSILCVPSISFADGTADLKKTSPEIVKSDDFSVRRFQEVVEASLKTSSSRTSQEDLIALRAKLILSERRWNELKEVHPENNSDPEKRDISTNRVQLLRASQAEMNHYQAKIARLEEKILKEKRKERNSNSTKKIKPIKK